MKLLLILLLLAAPVLAQTDTTYWPPPAENVMAVRDTLNIERKQFLQSASENTLLHQQNERLQSKEARFWGIVILAAIAAIAQATIPK
ncbi:hypothetical protein [Spirosoma areae]